MRISLKRMKFPWQNTQGLKISKYFMRLFYKTQEYRGISSAYSSASLDKYVSEPYNKIIKSCIYTERQRASLMYYAL